MKKYLFTLIFIFCAGLGSTAAESVRQEGNWQCQTDEHEEKGFLSLDYKNKIFRIQSPKRSDELSFPFSVSKNAGNILQLTIVTGDGHDHYLELKLVDPDKMLITFINEKDAPVLKCVKVYNKNAGD